MSGRLGTRFYSEFTQNRNGLEIWVAGIDAEIEGGLMDLTRKILLVVTFAALLMGACPGTV